jgi:spore maturation protein CgeB
MKIALIGNKDFDSLEYHLEDSFKYLGHEVFHIDIKDVVRIPYRYNYWATKLFPIYDKNIFIKIADKIIEQKPDLVIGTYRFIHPDCIRKIKKKLPSTPVIHINPDALTTFEYQQIFVSPYDVFFTKDPYIVKFMHDKMKLNAYYLPEALNLRVHKPIEKDRMLLENEVGIDVVAFGTMYPYRANMISQLIRAGINVTLFGVPDKRFPQKEITQNFRNEYITGKRKAEILMGSKIVFNNFHYAEIESVNVKYFEINGIGGFQLCDYKPTLEEYTKVPSCKYAYKTIDEAIDLIRYYLPKQKERFQIAQEQMEYFREHHTYEKRIDEIFNILFK